MSSKDVKKVQPYVSSEDGKLFDISFNTNNVSFKILEIDKKEILELLKDIREQAELLEEAYNIV